MPVLIQAQGVDEAVRMLDEIGARLDDLRTAQPLVNFMLSMAYRKRWDRWDGHLYETGRLMRSWTDHTADAVRTAHRQEIHYGSIVPYGRFYAGQILEIDSRMQEDLAGAMADYYAGERMVRGHMRGGRQVGAYSRRAASPLSAAHG